MSTSLETNNTETTPRRRHVSLVGPVILIGAGIVFLMNNMGLLGWDVWLVLFRFWPVLLIAAGLDVLIGRHSLLGSLVVVVLLIVALVVAVWFSMPGRAGALQLTTGPLHTEQISQPLQDMTRAAVTVRIGAADVRLHAGEEGDDLITGQVTIGEREQLERSYEKSGETGYYTLAAEGQSSWWPASLNQMDTTGRTWDLGLNPDVPIDLKVNTGLGRTELDLTTLNISNLSVNGGIGQAVINLPRQGILRATIEGGIGEVVINVPQGMAVRVRAEGGIGGVNVSGNYQRNNDEWVSPNYETAENRIDVRVKGGIGAVRVR